MARFSFILIVLLLGVTAVNISVNRQAIMPTSIEEASPSAGGPTTESPVQVGGDFALIDTNQQMVSDASFRGRVMLVFFGFTHCPDICPVTVSTLSQTMEKLGDKAAQVAPIFITVDPQRDTPQVMKDYLANFDSRLVGLTGSPDQIKQVTGAYKAYYSKAQAKDEKPIDDNYMVDHSGFIYVMGKDGLYVQHFPYDAGADTIIAAIQPLLN